MRDANEKTDLTINIGHGFFINKYPHINRSTYPTTKSAKMPNEVQPALEEPKPTQTKQEVAKAALEAMKAAMAALDVMNVDETKTILKKYIEENESKPKSRRKPSQQELEARAIGQLRSKFTSRKP